MNLPSLKQIHIVELVELNRDFNGCLKFTRHNFGFIFSFLMDFYLCRLLHALDVFTAIIVKRRIFHISAFRSCNNKNVNKLLFFSMTKFWHYGNDGKWGGKTCNAIRYIFCHNVGQQKNDINYFSKICIIGKSK